MTFRMFQQTYSEEITTTPHVGWVVVGSLPCSERFFSGYSGFPLSLEANSSKSQFDLEHIDTFQRVS